jgi:hypothetical protein
MKAKTPNLTPQQKAKILGDDTHRSAPGVAAEPTNPLVGLYTLCADSPRRLISLWDMNQIIAKDFLYAWNLLEHERGIAEKAENQHELASEDRRTALIQALKKIEEQCRLMDLKQSFQLCRRFIEPLENPNWHRDRTGRQALLQGLPLPPVPKHVPLPSYEMIYAQLRLLTDQVVQDMDAIRLAVVFKDHARFFEQDALFGADFHNAASADINREIKAASNCLAADLHTAAVFHFMRAAEHGLHALAVNLGAWPKTQPLLQYSEWGQVLGAIRTELERRRKALNQPRGPARDKELDFYDGLLKEVAYFDLQYFSNAYRNPVSHLRGNYTEREALLVYEKVGDFMKRLLGARVSLGGRANCPCQPEMTVRVAMSSEIKSNRA